MTEFGNFISLNVLQGGGICVGIVGNKTELMRVLGHSFLQ